MQGRRATICLAVVWALVGCGGGAEPTSTSAPAAASATSVTAGGVAESDPDVNPVAAPSTTGVLGTAPSDAPIVADHTTTDPYLIPGEWVAEGQEVVWAYGSTSHGTQLWAGAADLAEHDDRYAFWADQRRVPDGLGLRMAYDDGWSWDPGTFYDGAARLLSEVPQATAFLWSWCGELSDSGTDLDAYLDAMERLAADFPEIDIVYMTGHTDGGSAELAAHNDRIRRRAAERGAPLFDFADIEAFDPAGRHYPDAVDGCEWCSGWCVDHPSDCGGLEGLDCAHSHPLMCRLKAGALWWLSARLAGWDGVS